MYKKILLTQFGIPNTDTLEYKSNIPLAAGYLVAHSKKRFPKIEFIITPRVYSDVLDDVSFFNYAEKIMPDLFLFSLYLWNIERTLRICTKLKEMFSEADFLFGGPEVNPDNSLLLEHPAFTQGISGEGEQALEEFLSGVPLKMIGGALTKDYYNPQKKIKTEFDPDDNPYLVGLIEHSPDSSMFFETMRGCPFRCGFCYYNKTYSKTVDMDREIITNCLDYARKHAIREIFLLDPSFNVRPDFDDMLEFLISLNKDKYFEFNTELRADLLTDGQIEKLKELNLNEAEIGLQTTNSVALKLMNRSCSVEKTIANSVKMFKLGMKPKIDLLAGLPGDSLESFMSSAERVFKEKLFEHIQVFRLSLLSGTDFSLNRDKYGIVADKFPPYHVKSVKGFSEDEILTAINSAGYKFDTELFFIPAFLLSCDFKYLRKDKFVHFDSKIKPVHKIIFKDLSSDRYKEISNLCDSLVIHFIIEQPETDCPMICGILDNFFSNRPDTIYQIIFEFTDEFSEKTYLRMMSHIKYKESFTDRDASGYYGDCTVSTRSAIIVDRRYLKSAIYKDLCGETDVFISIEDLKQAEAGKFTDSHKIFVKGQNQDKIFQMLKNNGMLTEFVIFDSFRYEYAKSEITGAGRQYFPFEYFQ
jgi:radical SAM superfamily enzyme YgiQ (UPF0313 family)